MSQETRGTKRTVDDAEETAKRPKRIPRKPYEQVVDERLADVLAHWKTEAPTVSHDPRNVDLRAELITPPEDRNCAAIYLRPGGAAPALPLVAMNQWDGSRVEGGGAQNRPVVYSSGQYEKVSITGDQLHAEMKILQYLFTAGPYGGNLYIGISKPCCLRCAVVMNIQGFQSRGCGGGLWDAGWGIPPFVRNTKAKLQSFLGPNAWAWYDTLEGNQKNSFLMRLQTLTD